MKKYLNPIGWGLLICGFFVVMANESYWCLFGLALAFAAAWLIRSNIANKKEDFINGKVQIMNANQQSFTKEIESMQKMYDQKMNEMQANHEAYIAELFEAGRVMKAAPVEVVAETKKAKVRVTKKIAC